MRAALTLLMMGVGAALLITGFNGDKLSEAVLQVIRGKPLSPVPLAGSTQAQSVAVGANTSANQTPQSAGFANGGN